MGETAGKQPFKGLVREAGLETLNFLEIVPGDRWTKTRNV
jgi:hypothetical protein